MGWNCFECGALLTPQNDRMVVKAELAYFKVEHNKCSRCSAEYVTVFNPTAKKPYVAIIKLYAPEGTM